VRGNAYYIYKLAVSAGGNPLSWRVSMCPSLSRSPRPRHQPDRARQPGHHVRAAVVAGHCIICPLRRSGCQITARARTTDAQLKWHGRATAPALMFLQQRAIFMDKMQQT
jgi:hypothetical protein